jgi:serine/threonine protein kinase/ABC-type phosphate/phosphonate transport system substrate-binding protein
MSKQRQCGQCGLPIPTDSEGGFCPKCLLGMGIEGTDEDGGESGTGGNTWENRDGRGRSSEGRQRASEEGNVFVFHPGVRIGDYELLTKIGEGAMGVVCKARQVSLNRLVAVKMLRPEALGSPELVDRFLREAAAMGRMEHPNIVKIYEAGDFEGPPIICMQLIEGTRLDKHIAEAGLACPAGWPAEERRAERRQAVAVRMMAKLAGAVHYAHERGVLHRDIKPSNILIDAAGEPYLSDFGVAKLLGPLHVRITQSKAVVGTLKYMSPEQASGESELLTVAADVYSLGVVFYEMLTGQPPIQGENVVQIINRVLTQEPKNPTKVQPGVDPELATIAMKCLEKHPRRRYASAGAMAEDLERWLHRQRIRVPQTGVWDLVRKRIERNPALALAEASVFVLLIAVIGMLGKIVSGQRVEERRLQANAERLQKRIGELGTNQARFGIFTSEDRRTLLRKEPLAFRSDQLPLAFAVHTHESPVKMVPAFSPILERLEVELDRPIELRVYKDFQDVIGAMTNGEVQVARLGPVSYVLARAAQPKLVLLAQQVHRGTNRMYGLLFTRVGSGIRSVADLRGQKVAFGDEESTFGWTLACAALYSHGICQTNLGGHQHFKSHDQVRDAVLTDRLFAAGAANSNVVAKASPGLLTNLLLMDSVTFPWVGSTNLSTAVIAGIQRTLLQSNAPSILTNIDRDLTGFQPGREQDYDELKPKIEAARRFAQ